MDKEDFASDSDQSDEDFCPNDDLSAAGSEEESEDISEDEANGEIELPTNRTKKIKKLKSKRSKALNKAQQNKATLSDGLEETTNTQRRQTRQTDDNLLNASKKVDEKDEIETDEEEDKSRIDALWSDFLSDVKQPAPVKKVTANSSTKSSSSQPQSKTTVKTSGNKPSEPQAIEDSNIKSTENESIIVTEVVDFAGESVSIQKTISANDIKRKKVTEAKTTTSPLITAQKRTAGIAAGGLGSILNQINKKKKISVLEKTKLDWNTFKQDEGIDEQLQTHNKGKDGYLERQDFLQRTDLRQFEIEKNLRQTRRTQ